MATRLRRRARVRADAAGVRLGRAVARAWLGGAITGLAAFYLGIVVCLTAIALLPAVAGWKPYVIASGSMAPRIPAGAVVVAGPPADQRLAPGAVIVFADDAGRAVTHRIVEVDGDGRYRTKGDANAVADPAPVPPDAVRGVGRILVPLVGLPVVWVREGRWLAVLAVLAGTLAAASLMPARTPRRSGERPPTAGRQARRLPAALTLTVLAAAALAAPVAVAALAATAEQPGNRWAGAADMFSFAPPGPSASDLPRGATSAAQVFAFTLTAAMPAGQTVTIDLTEAFRGPVDYRRADAPVASDGSAVLETERGNSPMREARIVYHPPGDGLPAGATVTVTLPGAIATADVEAALAAVFSRSDGGGDHPAPFTVS